MKKVTVPISAHSKGLVPKENVRNNIYLIESIGAFPYEGVLITCENFEANRINTDALGCSFPYPQLFILSDLILVCTPTAIYEYPDLTTPKISGLSSGCLWTCADFKTFIILTNGQVMVKKNPETQTYSVDTSRPFGTCIADISSQLILTSPDKALSGNI